MGRRGVTVTIRVTEKIGLIDKLQYPAPAMPPERHTY